MSIALWVKVEALEKLTAEQQRRIEALEAMKVTSAAERRAAEIGQASLDRLTAQAEKNRNAGAMAAVRGLIEQEPDLTPAEIVERLRPRKLSVRRAQELARTIRAKLDPP